MVVEGTTAEDRSESHESDGFTCIPRNRDRHFSIAARVIRRPPLGDIVTPPLEPKTPVRVIAGPLRDMRGTVVRIASWGWSATVPQYVVVIRGLERILRADYLERAT